MGIFDFFKSRKKKENFDTSFLDEITMMVNESSLTDNKKGACVMDTSLPDESTMMSNENSSTDSKKITDIMDTSTLLEKLRDIAEDSTEYQISYGAMCYCPAVIKRKYKSCKCSICKRKIGKFEVEDYSDIVKQSGLVKKTGLAEVKIVCIDCLFKMCQSGDYTYEIKDWDIYESIVREFESSTNKNALEIDGLALLESYWKHIKSVREQKGFSDSENLRSWSRNFEPDFIVFLFKTSDSDKQHLTVTSPYNFTYFLNFIQNKRTWESSHDSTILLRDNVKIIERLTGLKL